MKNSLGLLLLILVVMTNACKVQSFHDEGTVQLIDVDSEISDQATVYDTIIAPYKAQLDATMGEVIGTTPIDLVKERPCGTLNQWFAKTLLAVSDSIYAGTVDVALQNYGGLRIPEIKAGPITVRTVFELMPFENMIVVLKVTGTQLEKIIGRLAADGGWPSAGFTLQLTEDGYKDLLIGGQPLQQDKMYTVALPDYVANGGNNSDYLIDWPREVLDVLIRDGVIDYLRKQTAAGNTQLVIPSEPNIKS